MFIFACMGLGGVLRADKGAIFGKESVRVMCTIRTGRTCTFFKGFASIFSVLFYHGNLVSLHTFLNFTSN